MTLLELVVVLGVLVALAAILVPLLNPATDEARDKTTRSTLATLRDTIVGKYRADMKDDLLEQFRASRTPGINKRPLVLPRSTLISVDVNGPTWSSSSPNRPNLKYLLINPTTEDTRSTYRPNVSRGWSGPYLAPGSVGQYTLDNSRGFTSDYGNTGDSAVLDAWGHPIVITEVAYTGVDVPTGYYRLQSWLISAGPDGSLLTDADNLTLLVDDRLEVIQP